MQTGSAPETTDKFATISPPTADQLSYQMQQLVEQGVITPEDAQAATAGRSDMDSVSTDPRAKEAQMAALAGLQDISNSGGMTDMDRANLAGIQTDEDTSAKGKRDAIIQGAQARGLGGSGLDLMSQMQNQQDAATRQSARDTDVAGQAKQRALEALIQGGQLGGQMQAQDFNQQAQKAQANDAISKFNAQNTQATNLANTQAKNVAQVANLSNKQNVANQNAAIQTEQDKQRGDVAQQVFNNRTALAAGQQNTANINSQRAGQNSQAQADTNNKNVGTALSAASVFSDERGKKDIEAFDPSDFLEKITPLKYQYKDPKHGEGDRYGTMAQDLEKSDAGASIVKDTPEGKVIDSVNATGPILASLSDLHKRLKELESKK